MKLTKKQLKELHNLTIKSIIFVGKPKQKSDDGKIGNCR